MSRELYVKSKYLNERCYLAIALYNNDRLCVMLASLDGEPLARVSTNLPDVELNEGEFLVKTWSENEGILECLLDQEVIEMTGVIVTGSHIASPVCRFTPGYAKSISVALEDLDASGTTVH